MKKTIAAFTAPGRVALLATALTATLMGCTDEDPAPAVAPDVEMPDPDDIGTRPMRPDTAVMDARIELDQGVPVPDMRPRPDAVIDAAPRVDAACECEGRQICSGGECLEPDTCETHRDCLDARICQDGMCRDGCVDDGDCPEGLTCDVATQTCTDQGPCMSDDQCGDGVCVEGMCAARCGGGDPCPGNQECDGGSGRCLEPLRCVNDDDCSADRLCQRDTCVDPCDENASCGGAQRCEGGICVEPDTCSNDLDCTGDRRCVGAVMNAICEDPCTLAGCDRDLVCDRETGRCAEAEPCDDVFQCFEGRVCLDGVCDAPCVEAGDCTGAQDCEDGVCVEPEMCNSNLDCLPGRVCTNGACRQHCENTPCGGLLLCERETGLCTEATPCADDTACFEGRVCEGQVCDDPCVDFTDCTGSMDCVDGRCIEPDRCRGPLDCLEGRRCVARECVDECVDGRCAGTRVCDQDDICAEGPDCAADRDCDLDRLCHPQLSVCAGPCAGDGDCLGGFECGADGLCRPPRFCEDDGQCPGEETCTFAHCYAVDCWAHEECPEDEVCVGFACAEALPGACDCPAGWACDAGHCVQPGPCPQAAVGGPDGGCPAGDWCAEDGACVDCLEDAHCAIGRCLGQRCSNPQACDADQDCRPGHTCRGGTCTYPRDACDEDGLDNHDFGFALPLPLVSISGLVACEGSADWFSVNDDVGSRVTVRFDAESTAIDLAVFEPGAVGATPADQGVALGGEIWVNAGSGPFLVRVSAVRGWSGEYTIVAEGGVTCIDDVFERPWRNDGVEVASAIEAGTIDANVCGGDVDHYRYAGGDGQVIITVGGDVNATINGQPSPQELDGEAAIEVSGDGAYTVTIAPDDSPEARCARAPLVALDSTFDVSPARLVDTFAPSCHDTGVPDQIFAFETPSPGVVSARLEALGAGTNLIIYDDQCGDEPLACGDVLGDVSVALPAGRHRLLVDGGFVGDVSLQFAPQSPACADAPALQVGADTPVVLGVRDGDIGGGCLDAAPGQAIYGFEVVEPSMVSIAVDSEDAEARVSVRSVCDSELGELHCHAVGGRARPHHLLPGRYTAVFQGAADITARLEIEPGGHFGPPTPQEACELAPAILSDGPVPAELDAEAADSFQPECRGPGDADLVFRLDVEELSTFSAVLDAPAPTTSLLLYSDCGAAPLDCGDFNGELHGELEAGTYYIVVDGDNVGQLSATLEPVGGQGAETPAEACAAAPLLAHGVPAPAHVGGGRENFSPACAVPGNPERVYRIEVPGRAVVNAALSAPDPTTSLMLYGDCDAEPVDCGDANGEIHRRVPAGTYYLVIDGRANGELLMELDPPPGVDVPETPAEACAAAPVLEAGLNELAVAPGADDLFAPVCAGDGFPDGAYRVEVAARSVVRATMIDPAATSTLLLYSDCAADPVACPDPDGVLQQVVDAGTYYLVVDGAYNGGLDLGVAPVGGCGELRPLPLGVDTAIQLEPGAPAYNGGCLVSTDSQGLYGFQLAEAADVRLTATSELPVIVTLRRVCDQADSQVGCAEGERAVFEGPLEAGDYAVIFEGAGAITAHLEIVGDEGGDGLLAACEPAAAGEVLAAGANVELVDSTAGSGDDFDAMVCGAGFGPGASDRVFLFGLDAQRTVTATAVGVGFTPVVVILNGGCLGDAQCSPANDPTVTAVLPAGQHAVVVDASVLGDEGDFTLTVEVR